jgi:FeS assembly SUF system protein
MSEKIDIDALKTDIIGKLKTVYDPEIPVDIYELGLIYEINVDEEGNVQIIMTLTSPNCPAAEEIPADIDKKVKSLELVKSLDVQITFDPPWDKDMMSEEAQLELGFL